MKEFWTLKLRRRTLRSVVCALAFGLLACGCSANSGSPPSNTASAPVQVSGLDARRDVSLVVVATRLPGHSGHDWQLDVRLRTKRAFTFDVRPFRLIPRSWILQRERQSQIGLIYRGPMRDWAPSEVSAVVMGASGRMFAELWDSRVAGVSPNNPELAPQSWPASLDANLQTLEIVVPTGAALMSVTTDGFHLTDAPHLHQSPLHVQIRLPQS